VILCLKSSPPCVTSVLPVRFEGSGGYAMRFPAWTDGRTRTALLRNNTPRLSNA